MEISYTNKLRITWFLLSITALLAIIALHISVNNNQVETASYNSREDARIEIVKETNLTLLYHEVQHLKSQNLSNIEPDLLIFGKRIDNLKSTVEHLKKGNITDAKHDIKISNKITEIQQNISDFKKGYVLVVLFW